MKYFFLFVVFGLIPRTLDKTEIIKEYYGGRSGYWNHTLKLYDNSGYLYTEWVHTGYRLRDTGNYKLTEKEIRLNTLTTKVNERHFGNKKRQEEIEKKYKNYRHFKNKSFTVDRDKIYLSKMKKLKNSTDSMEFYMGILFETKSGKE